MIFNLLQKVIHFITLINISLVVIAIILLNCIILPIKLISFKVYNKIEGVFLVSLAKILSTWGTLYDLKGE